MSTAEPTLTIGAVADATGVSVDVLRAWEARYGFPVPTRQPSGHRRYSSAQVTQIQQVQRDRGSGLSLDAAITRARVVDDGREASIYAGLRRRWPEQPMQVLSKRSLTAISRAIEDECLAQADRPVLIGCFQRERFYRQSERRWRELARTATWAVVFADFPVTRFPDGGAIEIAVAPDDPLLREWVVICDGPRSAACLAAVERIGGTAGIPRYEAMWSVDPVMVRDAARIAASLAGRAPGADDVGRTAVPPTDFAATLRSATALLDRTIAHLDA